MCGWNVLLLYTKRTLGNQLPLNRPMRFNANNKNNHRWIAQCYWMLMIIIKSIVNSCMVGYNCYSIREERWETNSRWTAQCFIFFIILRFPGRNLPHKPTGLLTYWHSLEQNRLIKCQIMHGSNLLLLYTRRTLGNQLMLNRPMLFNGNANNKIDC